MKTLRDVLPHEAIGYSNLAKHLDTEVVSEHEWGWVGTHKNVCAWWKLSTGHAVGWNESPSRGWSFPVVKVK